MRGKCVALFNFSRRNFSITNDIKMTSQLLRWEEHYTMKEAF